MQGLHQSQRSQSRVRVTTMTFVEGLSTKATVKVLAAEEVSDISRITAEKDNYIKLHIA